MHIIHKQLRRLTFDNNLIYAQKPQKSLHSLYTYAYKGVCNWTWSWHQKRPFRTIYETPIWGYIYVYMYISLVACVRPSSAKLIYLRGTTDMTENSDSLLPPIYTHEPHIYYALHYYYTFGNFLVEIHRSALCEYYCSRAPIDFFRYVRRPLLIHACTDSMTIRVH